MKKDSDNISKFNKKVQDEIRKRVFEESHKRNREKAEATDEQIEIDALSEVSGLLPDDIKRIAEEVKTEFKGSAESAEKTGRFKVSYLVLFLVIAGIAGSIIFTVVDNISKQTQKEAQKQAEEKKMSLFVGLLKAVEEGNIEMTGYFLDQGAPIQVSSPYYDRNSSALMVAAYYEHVKIVRLLLERGADITIRREPDNWTALDIADDRENQALVKILGQAMALAYPEQSPVRKLWEKAIPFSQYAFVEQVKKKNTETTRLFMEAGMDADVKGRDDTYDNISALTVACRDGNIEMVQLILELSGSTNKPEMRYPLEYTLRYKRGIEIIRILLDSGADPNDVTVYDALYDFAIAELLLKYGADINAGSGDNRVPALIQVLSKRDTIVDDATRKKWVRFLLDHGADVNDRGQGLISALKLARSWGNQEVINWIIKAGASEVDDE